MTWVREHLERARVDFEEVQHADTFTAQQLARSARVSGDRVAKTVLVFADGRPMMLVLPATHRVMLTRVQEMTGAAEVHLASEADLAALFPDCEIGAEPPLRRRAGVGLWMDESLRVDGEIVFSAGTHRTGIRMPFAQWLRVARPLAGNFAAETGRFPAGRAPVC